MSLARHHTRHSLEEIGGHFGGRDHTTVMHSIKAVDLKRQADKSFDSEIVTLADKLRRTNP
jgi:chromosomal replication initiator protein